jgi:hypothetical protein
MDEGAVWRKIDRYGEVIERYRLAIAPHRNDFVMWR